MKKSIIIMTLTICLLCTSNVFAQEESQKTKAPVPFGTTDTVSEGEVKDAFGQDTVSPSSNVPIGGDIKVPIINLQQAGIRWVLASMLYVAGPILLIIAVMAGVRLIILAEKEEERAKAHRTLLYAIIGLMVMSLAYAIIQNLIRIF
jgi:hypothetical protein